MKGKLIAFEGISCCGKSTQIELLKDRYEKIGKQVIVTSWKSDEIISQTIQIVKSRKLFTPLTYSLLHAVDFAKRYQEVILPGLKEGAIVIVDRYIYTALTRDMVRGMKDEYIRNLYSFAIEPNLTLYLEISPKESLKRRLRRHPKLYYHSSGGDLRLSDSLEESFVIYQSLLTEHYKKITEYEHFFKINALFNEDKIADIIWENLNKK